MVNFLLKQIVITVKLLLNPFNSYKKLSIASKEDDFYFPVYNWLHLLTNSYIYIYTHCHWWNNVIISLYSMNNIKFNVNIIFLKIYLNTCNNIISQYNVFGSFK